MAPSPTSVFIRDDDACALTPELRRASEVGIVRDSVLNATNSVEYFYESMETVAILGGGDLLRVSMTVCPDGASSALVAINPLNDRVRDSSA